MVNSTVGYKTQRKARVVLEVFERPMHKYVNILKKCVLYTLSKKCSDYRRTERMIVLTCRQFNVSTDMFLACETKGKGAIAV